MNSTQNNNLKPTTIIFNGNAITIMCNGNNNSRYISRDIILTENIDGSRTIKYINYYTDKIPSSHYERRTINFERSWSKWLRLHRENTVLRIEIELIDPNDFLNDVANDDEIMPNNDVIDFINRFIRQYLFDHPNANAEEIITNIENPLRLLFNNIRGFENAVHRNLSLN